MRGRRPTEWCPEAMIRRNPDRAAKDCGYPYDGLSWISPLAGVSARPADILFPGPCFKLGREVRSADAAPIAECDADLVSNAQALMRAGAGQHTGDVARWGKSLDLAMETRGIWMPLRNGAVEGNSLGARKAREIVRVELLC